MGVTDPRKLAVILRDLDDEMERWSAKASDILNVATYTQATTREAVHQARRRTLITTEQYYEDEGVYRSRAQSIEDLLSKYSEAVKTAIKLVEDVEDASKRAKATLTHWKNELQKAIAWQRRAEERVRRAEAELVEAERALARAERDLSNAEAELRRCRNTVYEQRNSKGEVIRRTKPDCSKFVAEVNRCQYAVRAAQQRVELARIELRDARAELARAIARVKACEQAVDYAQRAVATAELSLERAKNALGQAERSLDHVHAAERALNRAGELLRNEQAKVEDMNIQIQQSEDFLAEAQTHLISSTKYEESAQRYRIMARSEIQHRVEMLFALNRPELLGGISGDSWVTGGGGLVAVAMASGGGVASGGGQSGTVKDPTKEGVWLTTHVILALEAFPDVSDVEKDLADKKFPQEQWKERLHCLMEMLPLIQDGIGQNTEFWVARDSETQKDPKNGYGATYEEYFVTSPITVAQTESDPLFIVSGKERIWFARQQGIPHLPVRMMKRSQYLQPLQFVHPNGDKFELHPSVVEQNVYLRMYNMTRRSKVPEVITDGDAACVDLQFGNDGRAEITRFQKREQGFDAEMLRFAEMLSTEMSSESIFMALERKYLNTPEKRDWFVSKGYQISEDGSHMIVYKTLSKD